MKRNGKFLFIEIIKIAILVFSVVSVSYSWFLSKTIYTKQVEVTYADGSLSIANKTVSAYLTDIQGNMLNEVSLSGMVPNTIVPFYINLGNSSSHTAHVSLMLSGMKCLDDKNALVPLDGSSVNLMDEIYFSAMASGGYQDVTSDITVPSAFYELLSKDVYSLDNQVTYNKVIYSSFDIPANTDTETNPVQLLCNFYFNSDAENEYKNLSIGISKFLLKVL